MTSKTTAGLAVPNITKFYCSFAKDSCLVLLVCIYEVDGDWKAVDQPGRSQFFSLVHISHETKYFSLGSYGSDEGSLEGLLQEIWAPSPPPIVVHIIRWVSTIQNTTFGQITLVYLPAKWIKTFVTYVEGVAQAEVLYFTCSGTVYWYILSGF